MANSNNRIPRWKQIASVIILLLIGAGLFFFVQYFWFSGKPTDVPKIPEFNHLTAGKVSNNPEKTRIVILRDGKKTIDGNLKDWEFGKDSSFHTWPAFERVYTGNAGGNETETRDWLKKYYSFQGEMMEDSKFLYVAAKIGDPLEYLTKKNDRPKIVENLDEAKVPKHYLQIRYSSDSNINTNIAKRVRQFHLWKMGEQDRIHLGIWPGIDTEAGNNGAKTIISGENDFECFFKQVGHECHIEAKIPWSILEVRPSPDLTEFRCIWQVIRVISGNDTLRLVELVDNENGKFALTLDAIGNIDSIANDPAKGIRLWGKITQPKQDTPSK